MLLLAQPEAPEEATTQDPCEQDASLVCLGVLYGLGDFGEAGAEVLGVLVTTGAGGLLGLVMFAVASAIAGVGLLAASTRLSSEMPDVA